MLSRDVFEVIQIQACSLKKKSLNNSNQMQKSQLTNPKTASKSTVEPKLAGEEKHFPD